jgi:hypothetical protein
VCSSGVETFKLNRLVMSEITEAVTQLVLTDVRLDPLAMQGLVSDACSSGRAVELSFVKGDCSPDTAILAVVGFKAARAAIPGSEMVSMFLYDLKNAQASARLLVPKEVYIASIAKPCKGEVEGVMLLILRPAVSIDQTTGTLTITLAQQNQVAVVGRCKHFARCGAEKRSVSQSPDGECNLCRIPVDSSRAVHCSYHDKVYEKMAADVGGKRTLTQTELAEKPSDKRPRESLISSWTLPAPPPRSSAGGEYDSDQDVQEPEDVAFSLRNQAAAVESILGAAYSDNSGVSGASKATTGNRILQRADAAELRVAQKIIQSLEQAKAISTARQTGPLTVAAAAMAGNPKFSLSVGGAPAAAANPLRPVSALTQRVERQLIARSGNTDVINAANARTAATYSASVSSSATVGSAQRSDRPAVSAHSNAPYKLVGDTIINTANLCKNLANISTPAQQPGTAQSGPAGRAPATFQQLLAGSGSKATPAGTALMQEGLYASLQSIQGTQQQARSLSSGAVNRIPGAPPFSQNTSPRPNHALPGSARPTTAGSSTSTSATATASASASKLDAEIEMLLGRTSSHAAEADTDWAEGFGKRMDVLAKREYAQTKAAEVHCIGTPLTGLQYAFLSTDVLNCHCCRYHRL